MSAAQKTLPATLLAASRAANSHVPAPVAEGQNGEVSIVQPEAQGELDRQLSSDEVKKVWLPLLRLRQACCHPQVTLSPTLICH